MRRVVADTNVYVSALNFAGTAEEMLALARGGQFDLFVSPPILQEIEGVLRRKFLWAPRRAAEAIALIREFATLVSPNERVSAVTQDEPDNRILECALAAEATVIVSGDRHLLGLERFRDIPILSLREFLDAYRAR